MTQFNPTDIQRLFLAGSAQGGQMLQSAIDDDQQERQLELAAGELGLRREDAGFRRQQAGQAQRNFERQADASDRETSYRRGRDTVADDRYDQSQFNTWKTGLIGAGLNPGNFQYSGRTPAGSQPRSLAGQLFGTSGSTDEWHPPMQMDQGVGGDADAALAAHNQEVIDQPTHQEMADATSKVQMLRQGGHDREDIVSIARRISNKRQGKAMMAVLEAAPDDASLAALSNQPPAGDIDAIIANELSDATPEERQMASKSLGAMVKHGVDITAGLDRMHALRTNKRLEEREDNIAKSKLIDNYNETIKQHMEAVKKLDDWMLVNDPGEKPTKADGGAWATKNSEFQRRKQEQRQHEAAITELGGERDKMLLGRTLSPTSVKRDVGTILDRQPQAGGVQSSQVPPNVDSAMRSWVASFQQQSGRKPTRQEAAAQLQKLMGGQ